MIRGDQMRIYEEDEDSVETIETNDNDNNNNNNDDEDRITPGLQQEDESNDEINYSHSRRHGIFDGYRYYNEDDVGDKVTIPGLISRVDNDDSSSEKDDDTIEQIDDSDLYFQSSEDENDTTEDTTKATRCSPGSDRFLVDDLEEIEAEPIGGRMDQPKLPGMIRISGCNPNGIRAEQLKSHIQHSLDLEIDIQCYSEVNRDFLKVEQRQNFYEYTKSMNNQSRAVWGTSQVIVENDFKPGGRAIISQGKTGGRVKKSGIDPMGRWTYQLLDGQGEKDILIVSAYQCCKQPTNPVGTTAYHQQEIMLSETNRVDRDPRRNFYRDLKLFLNKHLTEDEDKTVIPILVGDWNEECKGTSNTQKLCDDFGLVNIFERLYPDQKQFKTYMRGSRTIDFVLAPPEIADRVTNFVYEPFL